MRTISDRSDWKLYLLLTDGKTLPTIRQHMAKICPFLESKPDIFPSYLPVSDINLAIEESIWHSLHVPVVVRFLSASSTSAPFLGGDRIVFVQVGCGEKLVSDFDVDVKTTCCHNNFQKHLRSSCAPTDWLNVLNSEAWKLRTVLFC